MKNFTQISFLLCIACFAFGIGSSTTLNAQCVTDYIPLTPAMFHYPPGETPPNGSWDIANMGDDQAMVTNNEFPCGSSHPRWTDDQTVGYVDFGSYQQFDLITIPIKWSPSGTLRFSVGLPSQNFPPFASIDFDNIINRPTYPECGVYRYLLPNSIIARYITIERVDGFNDAYEVAFSRSRGPEISGNIANECGTPIPNVTVTALSNQGESFTATTDVQGNYVVKDLPCFRSWTITPTRDETDLCGIDEDDIRDLANHIISLPSFTSPYTILAAEVNGNNIIDAFDVVDIRKFILGTIPDFTAVGGVNWRFIDANYVFPVPYQLQQNFPTSITTSGILSGDIENQDFIAVKSGDVNCSYDPACDEGDSRGGSERAASSNIATKHMTTTQVWPNPFQDRTTLQIHVIEDNQVNITVYDLAGKAIAGLSRSQHYFEGTHEVVLDMAKMALGTYICVVEQNGQREVLKLIKAQ